MATRAPSPGFADAGPGSLLRRLAGYPTRYLAPLPPPAALLFRGWFGVYLVASSVVSVVATALALAKGPAPGSAALALGVASALSVFYVVQVVPGGSLWTPADFLIFSAIFILGPVGVVAIAVGEASGYALRRRPSATLIAYAADSQLINAMIAWLLFRGCEAVHLPGGAYAAALLTGAVYECVGLLHVMLGTSLGTRRFVGWNWLTELKFTLPFSIGYAWAAVGAARLYQTVGLLGVSMVAIPVILFQGFLVYLARAVYSHQMETEANHQSRVQLLRDLVARQRTFVADASHELRTPLTTMSGGLEIMHQFPDIDADMRKGLVADALGETQRMANLVDSLLVLAQLEDGEHIKPVAFHWADLATSVGDAAKQLCAPRIVTAEISADLGEGFGDPVWLRRLFTILASNVAENTPTETHALFTVDRGSDGLVCATLADDGPGVPEAMIDQIFENFVQVDRSRQGSAPGLGLAIARVIVGAHGGTIGAEDVDPHGLRVVVRIPAAQESTGPANP